MASERITHTIRGDAPGQSTELSYFRIGPVGGKKVYLQAALHADEQPGILVLHYLWRLLQAAEAAGELQAQFVLFPMVNPLGMNNIQLRNHYGRYDVNSGVNFNRHWPDLSMAVDDAIADQLGADAEQNKRIVRLAIKAWLDDLSPVTALQQQQHHVLSEAYNADYVLDLHCDNDSLLHIYSVPQSNVIMQELSDWIGAAAVMTVENSGGGSFDEVFSGLWLRLQARYPDKTLPLACASATLEYRGQFDTFEVLNQADAERLYGFFQTQGLISGKAMMPKPPRAAVPLPLAATEFTRVEQAGLLVYQVELGQQVVKGQVIAELLALDGADAFVMRTPVYAGTSGLILSRNIKKYVWPGCSVAKIVGQDLLPSRTGLLLED